MLTATPPFSGANDLELRQRIASASPAPLAVFDVARYVYDEEVRRGLGVRAGGTPPWLTDYFELTELHVRPDAQARGQGEALLRALLDGADGARVLLSTPEHDPLPPSRAWRLYRRTGFRDVLRRHRFTGDSRPFAVLGRELPLEPPAARP